METDQRIGPVPLDSVCSEHFFADCQVRVPAIHRVTREVRRRWRLGTRWKDGGQRERDRKERKDEERKRGTDGGRER
eukprot:2951214-Rhodomonas_salina.1